ncbi:iron permease, FTR1 family protein [marine gamma proteobacterium HTCC2143]|uniref:Iron permease, FTR1 family protein n=1 Tax=marine gamma proteobacterium HTCC2143 TaxID=247633 RepID=A0YB46_9GAMM|nr:iron permease, FTR1 family protein [marine gamma proteobacterium HTCC2143]
MLIDAVVIILRETLEAAILIGILISISNSVSIKPYWLFLSLTCGIFSAVGYAASLGSISTWFDYVGQEVVNASIQYLIYGCLLATAVLTANSNLRLTFSLKLAMASAATLAMIREGSEIIIFFTGFLSKEHIMAEALTSGFIGLTIGMSVGALCYFSIIACPRKTRMKVQITLLSFIAAGMVAQATQLLIQADWLPSTGQLWDSTGILSEQSTVGQLAYATFGYEATPTPVEVYTYLIALLLIPTAIAISFYRSSPPGNPPLSLEKRNQRP